MKFVVVGFGNVGRAIVETLLEMPFEAYLKLQETLKFDNEIEAYGVERYKRPRHQVQIIDPPKGYNYQVTDFAFEADGWILCVPTPRSHDGRADTSLVEKYVHEITSITPDAPILLKSTTPVDLLAKMPETVTFSPEFLRSESSMSPTEQFQKIDFAIYGGKQGRFWHTLFNEITEVDQVRFMDIQTAGFLKYAENAFLATKVVFFNELYRLYKLAKVPGDFASFTEALALDKRIGFSHTQVPGPDGKLGFGGACLPKDSEEFTHFAKLNHTELELLEKAININELIRGYE